MRRLIFLPILAAILISCSTKRYEDCPPSHIIDDWGVTNNTMAFGEYDSLYYLFNPIGNILDSIYFNGNYTDSYYHADSTRVMLRYTTADSIIFRFDRMYAVETNPERLILLIHADRDTLARECVLHMKRVANTEGTYTAGPDSLFREMLRSGHKLRGRATNGPSSAEPEGSQNYEFVIYTRGFKRAMHLADSLNRIKAVKEKADTAKHHQDNNILKKIQNIKL